MGPCGSCISTTPASASSPTSSNAALVTDDTFLGFEPEVNLIAQAATEAKEQLFQVMEVKQEEDIWQWMEKGWEEWMLERDLVVGFVDKKAVVAAMKAVMVEIHKKWLIVSVRFLYFVQWLRH